MTNKILKIFITFSLILLLLMLTIGNAFAGIIPSTFSIGDDGKVIYESGDISSAKILLSSRLINANGNNRIPTIKSVYVKQEITGLDENDEDKAITVKSYLNPSDYFVEYYKVTEDDKNNYERTYTSIVQAIDPGDYVVRIVGKGNYTGYAEASFTIVGLTQKITLAKTSPKVHLGYKSFKVAVSANGDGTGFSYESSNPKVVSVTSDGYIKGLLPGRETITVRTVGSKLYNPASAKITVTVYPAKTYFKDPLFKVKHPDGADNIVVYYNKQVGCDRTKVELSTTKDFSDDIIVHYSKTEQRTFYDMDLTKTYYVRCCGQVKVVDQKGNYEYLDGYWSKVETINPQEVETIE